MADQELSLLDERSTDLVAAAEYLEVIRWPVRYNNRDVNDGLRTVRALAQAEGKRLMYSEAS
jgi:hypothetical protein